jgi:CRISPR-associated protein (TIGR03984 family)
MSDERWQEIAMGAEFNANPRQWLADRMNEGMPWLLAHADDGVIWGRRDPDGQLVLSGDVFEHPAIAIALRPQTLQRARVFGSGGELLAWRTGNGFAARLIQDGPELPPDTLCEKHLLWALGRPGETRAGFTLLTEGQRGLCHAPPVIPIRDKRPALVVWHYVNYDAEGQAYIALSRLAGLEA